MSIVHNFSDKQKKKFNIKLASIILLVAGIATIVGVFIPNREKILPKKKEETRSYTICIDSDFSEETIEYIQSYYLNKNDTAVFSQWINNELCDEALIRNPKDTNPYTLLSYTLYVPVVSFKSPLQNIKQSDLISSLISQKFGDYEIIWDKDTDDFLRSKYEMGVGQSTYSQTEIFKMLKQNDRYIAIIPFEKLVPSYKELLIDNSSVFDLSNAHSFVLADTIWTLPKGTMAQLLDGYFPPNNFDTAKVATLITTGTSQIGAGGYFALTLSRKDSIYMVKGVLDTLRKADALQVSNETSITPSCYQRPTYSYLCSLEKDLIVLKTIGTDVVGVNGNHIMDYGYKTYPATLNWYINNGLQYYGGGKSATDAHIPKIIGVGGVKVSFLGYNFIPPFSYYSTNKQGGSANVSLDIMKKDIKTAKSKSSFSIIDLNFGTEQDKKYSKEFQENAHYAMKYGADIVLGTNARTPLGIEIYNGKPIFYGQGGFISPFSKEGIIVKHIFYNKKYIGFSLIPIVYSTDHSLELADGARKDTILSTIYKQSIFTDEN